MTFVKLIHLVQECVRKVLRAALKIIDTNKQTNRNDDMAYFGDRTQDELDEIYLKREILRQKKKLKAVRKIMLQPFFKMQVNRLTG